MPAFTVASDPRHVGLIDHLFILRALILRDVRVRYRDNPFGFAMEFFRTVIVVTAHYYYFYIRNKQMPAGVPIEIFVIAGFSVWYSASYAMTAAMHGSESGGGIRIPGVTRIHLKVAKSIWAVLVNLVFCLASVLFLNLHGDDLPMPAIPLTFLIFFLAGVVGFAWGLLLDGLGRIWPIIQPVGKVSRWLLFVTCGIYFSLALAPPILGEIFWYNPVLHLVEYERYAFDPGYPVAMVTLLYPAACAAGLLFFALMISRCMRHLERN